jgi:hypothetical protein
MERWRIFRLTLFILATGIFCVAGLRGAYIMLTADTEFMLREYHTGFSDESPSYLSWDPFVELQWDLEDRRGRFGMKRYKPRRAHGFYGSNGDHFVPCFPPRSNPPTP